MVGGVDDSDPVSKAVITMIVTKPSATLAGSVRNRNRWRPCRLFPLLPTRPHSGCERLQAGVEDPNLGAVHTTLLSLLPH